jgi:hypothetical protein
MGGQQRRDIEVAVDVVGPAVQENHGRTAGGTGFGITDAQHAGIDVHDGAEGSEAAR